MVEKKQKKETAKQKEAADKLKAQIARDDDEDDDNDEMQVEGGASPSVGK